MAGRSVVTEEGRLWENYCVCCGRSTVVRVECVYTPPRLRLSAAQEATLTRLLSTGGSRSSPSHSGLDGSADISLPTALLDQLMPDTGLDD